MPSTEFLKRYLPEALDFHTILRQGAGFYKMWDSRTLALDAEYFFNMQVTSPISHDEIYQLKLFGYMKIQGFDEAATNAGLKVKKTKHNCNRVAIKNESGTEKQ